MISHSVVSDFLQPHGLQPARLFYPWGFFRQEYWSELPCPPLGDRPNPRIKPKSSALQIDSLPAESPGKPKNTGVGCLSLLQGIFPTQGSNPDLLHLQVDFLPSELPGKPKNTGVGSLSLLQGTSQPRNGTGVSCWILYQLSYQGRPLIDYYAINEQA